ncbi:MaoC/PaaZ C-terminal domain-containing protein [Rhodococcus sp. T2V]|uniref:MaoC/PaaZ C-terminal domain-containing protein n=1 Tax=Rhodococcus sp. T2V TaxID=3034164 RepID=UPI0023E21115|nr:MaoC/PaaZ C-terminal domain-containing protein [Rhodococcus sp. T2V]MDF3312238.1 MaoC/PaaZ C-terminal domain-containing protein [Rhodococcus sp. T2V]
MPYIEELAPGTTFVTPGRTIYLHDITSFAELTGDWHEVHTNESWAASSVQGKVVAHGLLVLSYAAGLMQRGGVFDDKAIAFLDLQWKILEPVFPGDTIWVTVEVADSRRSTSKPDRGVATLALSVRNQHDAVVATANWTNMFQSRDNVADGTVQLGGDNA